MGTNSGVQIRKLFEPEKFPGATVLRVFDIFFGTKEVTTNLTLFSIHFGNVC